MTLYVASMPRPDAASDWYEKTRGSGGGASFKEGEWMFALVATTSTNSRMVFAFFDQIPDDERLKARMQEIGTGKARWQAGFDAKTRSTVVNPAE